MRIAACVKWVDLRPEVDPLTGAVRTDQRTYGWSAADEAAVETALVVAETWGATTEVVCAGPPDAERGLRRLLAAGVERATLVPVGDDASSEEAAAAVAAVLGGVDLVVCGDYSLDRGTGAVPAFLAHHLGAAQALGLVRVTPAADATLVGIRRVGGGRTEWLDVRCPGVVSVEGSAATLRRASLAATLAAERAGVAVSDPPPTVAHPIRVGANGPLRPRPRVISPPSGRDARGRIVELTGALVDRTPPRRVDASPTEAAELIVGQLVAWGYLEQPDA